MLLAGCGRLAFDAQSARDGDAGAGDGASGDSLSVTCTPDNFSAGAGSTWLPFTTAAGFNAAFANSQVTVALPPSSNGYGGIDTIPAYNFSDGRASIEVPTVVASGNTECYLMVFADANNFYAASYDFGMLRMTRRLNGADLDMVFSYDPVNDRWWKIEHHADTNTIEFLTSANGSTWFGRWSVDAAVPINQMTMEIAAGEYGGGLVAPGMPVFDNFDLCLP